MRQIEKRLRALEEKIKPPESILSWIWIGDPPEGYEWHGKRKADWKPENLSREYETAIVFLPEKDPKPE